HALDEGAFPVGATRANRSRPPRRLQLVAGLVANPDAKRQGARLDPDGAVLRLELERVPARARPRSTGCSDGTARPRALRRRARHRHISTRRRSADRDRADPDRLRPASTSIHPRCHRRQRQGISSDTRFPTPNRRATDQWLASPWKPSARSTPTARPPSEISRWRSTTASSPCSLAHLDAARRQPYGWSRGSRRSPTAKFGLRGAESTIWRRVTVTSRWSSRTTPSTRTWTSST